MSKVNIHKEAKQRRENLRIALMGHNKRIAEKRALIKRYKVEIRMFKTMKKQVKNAYKLKENEIELAKTEKLARSLA